MCGRIGGKDLPWKLGQLQTSCAFEFFPRAGAPPFFLKIHRLRCGQAARFSLQAGYAAPTLGTTTEVWRQQND